MSTKSNQKPTLSLKGFRGVDRRANHTDGGVASDLVNFRIRTDGSLEKRYGFRLLTALGAPIRAFYKKISEGEEIGYALAGNTLFAVNLLTADKEILGTVATSSGKACIFFYKSLLYLLDEQSIYVLENGSLSSVDGYVPLIGKDWPNDYVGEPYEPRNILTRRARISYVVSNTSPSIFMCTGEPVESVDAVWRNGVLLPPENYYIDEGFQTVNVLGTGKGDRLEIYLTMKSHHEDLRRLLLTATRSTLFGGLENYRLFFWGCDDPSMIFCTSFVPKDQALSSSRHGGNANDLYFPAGYEFHVGAEEHRIQGCVPHYDRLLIFTENDTWMAKADVSGFSELSLTAINNEIGCASFDGVASVGNDPISVGKNSLYRWHQQADIPDRCNALRVSEEIDSALTLDKYRNTGLYYDRHRDELWFFHRESGEAWICNLSARNWFRFTGIYAEQMFDAGGEVGFLRDQAIFVFEKTAYTDWKSGGGQAYIEARYTGALTDFGSPDCKNLSQLIMRGDVGGGPLYLFFLIDQKKELSYLLFPKGHTPHFTLRKRLSSPRFRYGRVSILAPDIGRPVIHGMTLHTR